MFCSCKPLQMYNLKYDDLENNNLESKDNETLENNFNGISDSKNINLTENLINNQEDNINYMLASKLYRDNIGYKFIEKYYRIGYSFNECIHSLFFCHNETVNIWSHFISCIIFIFLLIFNNYFFTKELWISNLVIIGSIIIFFVSTLCHLFNPMFNSIKTHKLFFLLDFIGIIIGILIFEIVLFYLLLNKQMNIFYILMSLVIVFNFLSILIKTYYILQNNIIVKPKYIYYTLILINTIIILTSIILTKETALINLKVLLPFAITNIVLIGSIIFNLVYNYPERVCIDRFDLCCSSHQIWHFITSFYLLSLVIQVTYWINYIL